MKDSLIFLPVIIQMLLTFWLYIYLGIAKTRALKLDQVDEERRKLHDDAWPDSVLQINNCIRNQFEVPVLFYVITIVLWLSNSITVYIHALLWMFVASRIFHAYIHVGSNYVPMRKKVFMFGTVILLLITLYLGYFVITMPNA